MDITVADDWQQGGLGTALAHDLARRAAEEGVERFTAEVLTDNSGIHRLVQHLRGGDPAGQRGGGSPRGGQRRVLRSAASGDFLVVPGPLRWWLRLSSEVTKTLMVPVDLLRHRRR